MIERLLAAESAFADGELEVAGRLFAQVAEADARNAIAVVGLARIAAREGRPEEAQGLLERALAIDPDEAAAQRLLRELYVAAALAEPEPLPTPAPLPTPVPPVPPDASRPPGLPGAPVPVFSPESAPSAELSPPPEPAARPELPATFEPSEPARASLLGRLRAWLAGLGRRS